AHDVIGIVAETTRLLPAIMEPTRTAGILVNDREMVENVPELGCRAHLPSSQGHTFYGRHVLHGPGHFVDAVNRLLGNMVPRKPGIIIPIFHLILHIRPLRLPREGRPNRAGVIDSLKRSHFPDRALVYLTHDRAH